MPELNFKKRKWMIKQYEKGVPISQICKAQNVTRRVFYLTLEKYESSGLDSLRDKTRGRKPTETQEHILKEILKLRREGHGVRRIEGLLHNQGIDVPHNRIRNELKKLKLINPEPKKGRRYNYIRWERLHSNSLWQTDYCWQESQQCWLTAWLDDHSRLITAAEYVTEATTDNSLFIFEKGVRRFGLPRETLSDRGTQYYPNLGETSRFLEHMNARGIKHIYASIKKPTTCGKLERWWRTHNDERWEFSSLRSFVNHYNYKRPHMSLNYLTPYEVWKRDL